MPTEDSKPTDTKSQEQDNASETQTATEPEVNEQPTMITLSVAEVEQLRKEAAERNEYLDLARRTQAEFQNYQKRIQRERESERDLIRSSVVTEMLPVLDNLERALKAAKDAGEENSLVQGVSMVQGQFLEVLKRFGVTRIEALDQPFDPNLHEALTQMPSADHVPNTVIHVEETGYKLNDRVIRAAKVVVSSAVG